MIWYFSYTHIWNFITNCITDLLHHLVPSIYTWYNSPREDSPDRKVNACNSLHDSVMHTAVHSALKIWAAKVGMTEKDETHETHSQETRPAPSLWLCPTCDTRKRACVQENIVFQSHYYIRNARCVVALRQSIDNITSDSATCRCGRWCRPSTTSQTCTIDIDVYVRRLVVDWQLNPPHRKRERERKREWLPSSSTSQPANRTIIIRSNVVRRGRSDGCDFVRRHCQRQVFVPRRFSRKVFLHLVTRESPHVSPRAAPYPKLHWLSLCGTEFSITAGFGKIRPVNRNSARAWVFVSAMLQLIISSSFRFLCVSFHGCWHSTRYMSWFH